MDQSVEFGLICSAGDELALVKNVNVFLKSKGLCKLSRRTPTGVRNPDDRSNKPRYAHFYCCSRTKQRPSWYFDLYPNLDLDGNARFPDRLDCGWTLFLNRLLLELNTSDDGQVLQQFQEGLLGSIGYSVDSLYVYGPRECRR
jgi:hypothetical protein